MQSLVSTQWLADQLGAPDLVVLDASHHLPSANRNAREEFFEAHIPGARFLDLATLIDPQSPVPAALPSDSQLAERLASLGIGTGTRLVLYDDSAIRTACRAWLILRMAGWDKLAILDGRFGKWQAEGRVVESGTAPLPEEATPLCLTRVRTAVRSKETMLANVESRAEQVVDARDAGRFTGEIEDAVHGLPGGHIPGARHLFFGDLLKADGSFRSPEEIASAFNRAGIEPAAPLVASCGSGLTASVVLFAHHLLGHAHGAIYDGSWSEWGADPAMPIEKGPAR